MTIQNLSPVAALAAVDLLTQGAAISATLLYAVPATQGGLYHISVNMKVTRAAASGSPSSTLGALTITYTDTDGVAQSLVVALATQAGASATTNTGNTTTSLLQGSAVVNAKAGTNINYAIGYATAGTTSMQYEAHLAVRQA